MPDGQLASWTEYQMWTTTIRCSSVSHPLSPCVGPGQVPIPEGMSPPASASGAAQTKSQAGVTGNACCLVGEGGEGNCTARSYPTSNSYNVPHSFINEIMASHSTISYSVLLFCLRVRCWLPPPLYMQLHSLQPRPQYRHPPAHRVGLPL